MSNVWVLALMAGVVIFGIFGPAAADTYIVDDDAGAWADFSSVQEAVNASSEGDTILVYNGTYYENVVVNVTVRIEGNGTAGTTIDGGNLSDVIAVLSADVEIVGMSLINSGEMDGDSGLDLQADNATIVEVFVNGSNNGIRGDTTHNHTIEDCVVMSNNMSGILFDSCSGISIEETMITSNGDSGIYILDSESLSIEECNISGNLMSGIYLDTSYNVTITDSTMVGNGNDGVTLMKADFNIFHANNISSNGDYGIYVNVQSNNNSVHHNVFIDNVQSPQSYDSKGDNEWDDGFEGNYWSDYTGNDTDEDRVGDTPYVLGGPSGTEDRYPLMEPRGTRARVIVVDDDGDWADFDSIYDAVEDAVAGDTVLIYNGTYTEHPYIDVSISIIGNGSGETTIDGEGVGTIFEVHADNVTVSRITLIDSGDASGDSGLFAAGADGLSVSDVSISECMNGVMINECDNGSLFGVRVNTPPNYGIVIHDSDNWTVENSTVLDAGVYGISIDSGNDVTITNCTVTGSGSYAVRIASGQDGRVHHNNFRSNNNGSVQAYDSAFGGSTSWDDGISDGNYWSDWNGSGNYSIGGGAGSVDNFPLRSPWANEAPVIDSIDIAPTAPVEGDNVTFDAMAADPDGRIETVLWNSSLDGSLYEGPELSYFSSSLSNGTHNISLAVMDNLGSWNETVYGEIHVNGIPRARIVSASPNETLEGEPIYLEAGYLDDGSVIRYKWNSSIDGLVVNTTEALAVISNLSNGTHQLTLTVRDDLHSWSDGVTTTVRVNGIPRAAIVSIDPETPAEGDNVTFYAGGTDDSALVQYSWNSSVYGPLYNGTNTTVTIPTIIEGYHNISLKVADDEGVWSSEVWVLFHVTERPIAWIESISPTYVLEGGTISFVGNGSDDGTVEVYRWTSSLDGVIYEGAERNFSTDSLGNGTHTVHLDVQDDSGIWSDAVWMNVTVNGIPQASIFQIIRDSEYAGEKVTFAANVNEDGDVVRYVWNSSIDGEFYNGTRRFFDHYSLSVDDHNITLVVQDDHGTWSPEVYTDLTVLEPLNMRPTAAILGVDPDPVMESLDVSFQGRGDDTDGSVVRYIWNSSIDGVLHSGTDVNITLDNLTIGDHAISLVVRDGQGAWSYPATYNLTVEVLRITAFIIEISPDPALWNEDVTFTGSGRWGNASLYHWHSSLDGDLVFTTEAMYTTTNLTNGTHVISLRIMNDTNFWSDTVQANLTVLNETTALPDLSLLSTDVSYWPEDPREEEIIVVNATVRNLGYYDADDVTVSLKINGSTAGQRTLDIPRGGHVNVSFNFTLLNGTWDVQIVVDPDNATGELAEDNNAVTFTIEIEKPSSPSDDGGDDLAGTILLIILLLVILVVLLFLSRKLYPASRSKDGEKPSPKNAGTKGGKGPVTKPAFGVLMKVKCSECSKHFTIEKESSEPTKIVCPFCGTKGEMK